MSRAINPFCCVGEGRGEGRGEGEKEALTNGNGKMVRRKKLCEKNNDIAVIVTCNKEAIISCRKVRKEC